MSLTFNTMKPETILEIRHKSTGYGYQRQRWPLTTHHILRLGVTEARLILPHAERLGFWSLASLLIAGLIGGAE